MEEELDPFSDLQLAPQLGDACGPLLEKAKDFKVCTGDNKTIYLTIYMCKRGLQNRPSFVWSRRLGGDKAAPCWRVLITKRNADLQGRFFHGAIACNAIVCAFNPAVSNTVQCALILQSLLRLLNVGIRPAGC